MSEVCEYSSPVKVESNYFAIPSSIILNTNLNEKRITIFSYFAKRRDLDNEVLFSINHIVKWMGKKPNRTANGINNKIIEVVNYLKDNEYLKFSDDLNNSSIDAVFNLSKIKQENNGKFFAVVYTDELKKILEYKNSSFSNVDVILMVFAYLRMKIFRRSNKFSLQDINKNNKNDHQYDIESRKLATPDAYDCFYYEIAKELGLTSRIVSKAVEALNDLGLIYSEPLPRIKYNDKWKTDRTIFCNTYKRENGYLLASGESYYLEEVENKKKKLKLI